MPALLSILFHYLPQIIAVLIEVLRKKQSLTPEETVHLEKLTQIKELLEK